MWLEILKKLKSSINFQSFQTWFKPVTLKEETASKIILSVPNNFIKNWLEEHYRPIIMDIAKTIFNKEVDVEFVLEAKAPEAQKPGPGIKPKFLPEITNSYTQIAQLNPKYSFSNFVIGPSNRFAHAAALAVAESPARAYNPLFIYGGVGLGKTHLMQAIGRYIKEKRASLRLLYVASETFVNELIDAIQKRTTIRFRQTYRHVDILLIDDVHLIAGKDSTQEEFFHTFNTLYDSHKQIVVTSDRPPKVIPGLEERLVSRFEWGLVADIQPPDFETRVAILREKAESENWVISNEVIDFIAQNIKYNIRTLEGSLNRIMAHQSLTKISTTLESVRDILKDTLPQEGQKQISLDLIKKNICVFFDVRPADLDGPKRNKNITMPRQIAMYICRGLTKHSLPEIGESFGGRDHTTVIHACQNISAKIKQDDGLRRTVDKIIKLIKE